MCEITVLVETKNGDMSHLSSYLTRTHSKCIHNTVEFDGRKGQGVAIYVHNSISDLVHIWKVSNNIQIVWVKVCGSVFGVEGRVMLGGVYINLLNVILQTCFQTYIWRLLKLSPKDLMLC